MAVFFFTLLAAAAFGATATTGIKADQVGYQDKGPETAGRRSAVPP